MCVCRTEVSSFQKHMTKAHFTTCAKEKLAEMCTEAEQREEREGLNLNDIIEEERERQEKRKAKSEGLLGMFRRKQEITEPELEIQDTIPLECFLCQGAWTGATKDDLGRHLEKDHKVIFGIKLIIELSWNQIDEAEPTETMDHTDKDDDDVDFTVRQQAAEKENFKRESDAVAVKTLVEMKFSSYKKRVRYRTRQYK